MTRLTLLAVFAHPDDEAFSIGGTLSRYAAEGVDVHLVSATRGEAGEIRDPKLATKANLPQVREKELRCACETYGIHPPQFLDYVDGQLAIVNQGQAVGKLVRIIRELQPQVMVTYGPEGIYGHYDHIAIHRWTTIAFDLAADAGCYPDGTGTCSPHQVSKLYYAVMPEEMLEAMSVNGRPPTVNMDGVPFPMVGYKPEQINAVIDVREYFITKMAGLMCHATQISVEETPQDVEKLANSPLTHSEFFLLGKTAATVPQPAGVETDLFAGLR